MLVGEKADEKDAISLLGKTHSLLGKAPGKM
jgi:hypothetical protein